MPPRAGPDLAAASTLNVSSSFDYLAILGAYYGVPALTLFMVGFLQVEARLWKRSAGYKFAAPKNHPLWPGRK